MTVLTGFLVFMAGCVASRTPMASTTVSSMASANTMKEQAVLDAGTNRAIRLSPSRPASPGRQGAERH
jgi:hypothetical protein